MWMNKCGNLWRGCKFHWKQSVEHVSRSYAIVQPELSTRFMSLIHGLSTVSNSSEFKQVASSLLLEFPALQSWALWWLRDVVASSLFSAVASNSLRRIWSQIPATSNPVELQHSFLHKGVGKKMEDFPGFKGLWDVAEEQRRQFEAVKCMSV
jgi:hypothetical protein